MVYRTADACAPPAPSPGTATAGSTPASTGDLKRLLTRLDSTCDRKPSAPVRLHRAKGDTDVAYSNAAYCRRQLKARRATVSLTDAGKVDHNQGVHEALPKVVAGFTSRG
ncbi:hypothetical protein AB0K18_06930 [Nonomuraea sp. NPDC049421]|uniref:hypothetical protein n=1 Tax=Nonomuraea sp. NPDC049421 TaxID=3155275 RepID=UPI00342C6673